MDHKPAATPPFFFGMDLDRVNNLMLLEEKLFSEWPHYGDSLPEVPYLLSGTDDLVPLPESLDPFDDTLGFSPSLISSDTSLPSVPCQYHVLPEPLNPVHLEDIDLEPFAWPHDCVSTSNNEDLRLDPLPLNACDFPIEALDGASGWDGRRTTEKRVDGRTSRLNDVGFDEIKNYFYMPITKAAKEMNVGLTVLKKRCRELGIARWPHRKMKSLKSLIHNVQELGKGVCEESIRKELETLEEHKKLMEENPEMQLTERTKKLRQACFKANYKRRRLSQQF
ncbi:unnamed protein product [Musa textilis]